MSEVLSFFDAAYLINLDSRPDRLERMDKRLGKLGIPYTRVAALKPTSKGRYFRIGENGIAQTHLYILQWAKAQKLNKILIIEDDAVFRDDLLEQWAKMRIQLITLKWDFLFLGHRLLAPAKIISTHILQATKICQCHFFAINNTMFDPMIAALSGSNRTPVDLLYGNPKYNVLAVMPQLSLQEPGESDINPGYRRSWVKCAGAEEFAKHCTDEALK